MGVCNRLLFYGRLQNAPTQHTLKVIDYQSNQLLKASDFIKV